jgi:hypothetical protein
VGKESLFQPGNADDGKLQTLSRVHGHEGQPRIGLVLIRVRDQRRMIDEIPQGLALLLGFDRGGDQFLDVPQPPFSFPALLPGRIRSPYPRLRLDRPR